MTIYELKRFLPCCFEPMARQDVPSYELCGNRADRAPIDAGAWLIRILQADDVKSAFRLATQAQQTKALESANASSY